LRLRPRVANKAPQWAAQGSLALFWVQELAPPAIDLVDGDHLRELMKSYKLGVDIEWVEAVQVKPEWFSTV
jgi:hypothetical protein